MATKNVKQHSKVRGKTAAEKAPVLGEVLLAKAVYLSVATELIDFSPFNYRKHFSESALEQFAAELKQHVFQSPQ
ncbi:MAG: hypothetical protein J0I32_09185 [Sphingobacteriales bacterium]|nr:hypothetical protein [Sphingobacteriales bacterium]OJW00172.1 MAG: hypothetical protein BGO52_03535 [Sphingobacteriales bacterium 44-61]